MEMYSRKENLNALSISCQKSKCKICEKEVKWSVVQFCLYSVAWFFDLERNKDKVKRISIILLSASLPLKRKQAEQSKSQLREQHKMQTSWSLFLGDQMSW